jgi:hypothetical protein
VSVVAKRFKVRRVAVAVSLFPGLVYGAALLLASLDMTRYDVSPLVLRAIGLLLLLGVGHCVWRLARDTHILAGFVGYVGAFAAMLFVLFFSYASTPAVGDLLTLPCPVSSPQACRARMAHAWHRPEREIPVIAVPAGYQY